MIVSNYSGCFRDYTTGGVNFYTEAGGGSNKRW